jgi:cell division protein ZapA (FtsZ GTPase activity inhibitor)
MQNFITISLLLGDRNYRVKIAAEDEEGVRNMAKKLNDQISGFKLQYGGKDMQDYLESKDTASIPDLGEILDLVERMEVQLDKGLTD